MKKATVAIAGGGFCGAVAAIRLLASPGRGGPSLPFGRRDRRVARDEREIACQEAGSAALQAGSGDLLTKGTLTFGR